MRKKLWLFFACRWHRHLCSRGVYVHDGGEMDQVVGMNDNLILVRVGSMLGLRSVQNYFGDDLLATGSVVSVDWRWRIHGLWRSVRLSEDGKVSTTDENGDECDADSTQ